MILKPGVEVALGTMLNTQTRTKFVLPGIEHCLSNAYTNSRATEVV